jgi:hypothetical protein
MKGDLLPLVLVMMPLLTGGHTDGAGRGACTTGHPGGAGSTTHGTQLEGTGGFTLSLPPEYLPLSQYTITLTEPAGDTQFSGFVVLPVGEDGGSIAPVDIDGRSRRFVCTARDGLTHTDSSLQAAAVGMWTSPPATVVATTFQVTVLLGYGSFFYTFTETVQMIPGGTPTGTQQPLSLGEQCSGECTDPTPCDHQVAGDNTCHAKQASNEGMVCPNGTVDCGDDGGVVVGAAGEYCGPAGTCDAHAKCQGACPPPGPCASVQCVCVDGFTGDGWVCMPTSSGVGDGEGGGEGAQGDDEFGSRCVHRVCVSASGACCLRMLLVPSSRFQSQ